MRKTYQGIRSGAWFLVLGSSVLCTAGDRASIHGVVRNTSGAPMQNTRLVLKASGTNTEFNAVTDQKGNFQVKGIAPGHYVILLPDATTKLETPCDAQDGQDSQCDIVISSAGSAENRGVIGAATVSDLPVNGRDVTQATTLEAGVSSVRTQQNTTDTASGRGQRGFGQQVSLSGARPQQNNYLLDGVSTNDYANSAPGSVLGLSLGADAVEKLGVNTSSYPAQFGRTSGGVIQAVTRSGSNAFHGSVYEFLRNSALDARNYFDNQKPPFRRNQFGAAAAMPIWKHHTYIFGNYEGLRQSLGMTQVDTVPSSTARQGKLSAGAITVDPLVVPYLALYPLPNSGLLPGGDSGIFRFPGQEATGEDYTTIRVDHTLGRNDKLATTYVFDRARTVQPDQLDFKLNSDQTKHQLLSFTESHGFNPNTLLSLRFGLNRVVALIGKTPAAIDPRAADTALGFLPGHALGNLTVVGLTSLTGGLNSPSIFNFHWTSLQWYADMGLKRGPHNITVGAVLERTRNNISARANQNGGYRFQSLQQFLTNDPFALIVELPGSNADRGLRQTILGFYLQDDLPLSSSLTVNLGLRYEMSSVPTDANNRLAALRHVQDKSPHLGDPYFSNPTKLNFEPRLGIAWSPTKGGHLVIRSGFGIFDVLPLSYEFELLSLFSAPYFQLATLTELPQGSFPFGGVNIAQMTDSPRRNMYIESNPNRNYVMHWNLDLEEQVGRNVSFSMGYVGSRGVHQPFRVDDMDIVLPSALTPAGYFWPTPAGSGQRVNPAVGDEDGLMWKSDSFYNAMQVQARAAPFLGLQLEGAYTWGKAIDTCSATIAGDQFSNSIASLPWFDMRLNRGPSDFNIEHNFTLHFTWPLPTPNVKEKALRAVGTGWQLGGAFQASSGVPFTLLIAGDPLGLNNTGPVDVPDRVNRPGCASAVNNPHALSYVNLNCFAFPSPATRRGNLGRNSLTGPGLQNWDVSFHKDTFFKRISDQFDLQFRVDLFNLFNHANFAPPVDHNVIFDQHGMPVPGGGLIRSTQTPPRQIQIGLKVIW